MQYLAIIKTLLSLLPLIIQVVQAIEAAIPESGAGKAKLELVKATIQSGYTAASDTVASFEAIWPAISSTVSAVVSTFNALGKFNKQQ